MANEVGYCQHVGGWTNKGCQNEALSGDTFCHAHQVQRDQDAENRKWMKRLGLGIVVLAVLITAIVYI